MHREEIYERIKREQDGTAAVVEAVDAGEEISVVIQQDNIGNR